MATVNADKTVSFKGPYTGQTFQKLTQFILGQDGYLSGGETTDDGVTITIGEVVFVQRGIVTTTLASVAVPVPTAAEPWFIVAGVADDNPLSGAQVIATADLRVIGTGTIIAIRTGGAWDNPIPVDVKNAPRAGEAGTEDGFSPFFNLSGTTVTSIDVNTGSIVDADNGRRVPRPVAGTSAEIIDTVPARPHAVDGRTDYVVRRQIEAGPIETRAVIGPVRFSGTENALELQTGALDIGSITRPHYYAKRAGALADQWWAWGRGDLGSVFALRVQAGPAGEGFAATSLLTAAGTITEVWIAGQRASDDAILLLYIDSGDLRFVSFSATLGTVIDAAVTIGTGPVSHMRAAIASGDTIQVVYERDDGPRQQIYTTRVSLLAASFGTAVISPRIVVGADTGRNDTWPSIAMNRKGEATVSWISGTGSNEFGNLIIAQLDQNGTISGTPLTLLPASDAALTTQGSLDGNVRGFVAAACDDFRRSWVVITDQDDLFVATLGTRSATSKTDIALVYSPSFQQHGWNLLSISSSPLSGVEFVGIAAASGEQGELLVSAAVVNGAVSSSAQIYHSTLNTDFFRNGLLEDRSVLQYLPLGVQDPTVKDIAVVRGCVGEFQSLYINQTAGAQADEVAPILATPVDPHPRDIYLVQWEVPAGGTVLNGKSRTFEIFNTRSKKTSYPILVGNRGDFQGYNGIADAINAAARAGGGQVVLRPGCHRTPNGLTLPAGISLRGEGGAYLDLGTTLEGIILGTIPGGAISTTTGLAVSGQLVTADNILATARAGDRIFISGGGGSGFHTVVRNLGKVTSTANQVLVDNVSGAPALGTTISYYAAGIGIENVIIRGAGGFAGTWFLSARGCWAPQVRNIRIEGSNTASTLGDVFVDGVYDLMIDGLDIGDVSPDLSSGYSVFLRSITGGVVRDVSLRDGQAPIQISTGNTGLHLLNCHGDNSNAALNIYVFDAAISAPVYMTDCEGRVSAAAAQLALIHSNVGRLRVGEGFGALPFEDDNTRASGIADLAIKLSSTGNKKFNGVSSDVITDAVNERLVANGGAMTGGTIAGTAISGSTIATTDITGGTIAGAAISGGTIATADISGGTIAGAAISGGTIATADISGGTETGTAISGGTITAADISGGTITGETDIKSSLFFANVGVQTMFDSAGQLSHPGDYFFDDFHADPTDAANGWTTNGAVTPTWDGNNHKVTVASGGFAGDFSKFFGGGWAKKPVLRMRAAWIFSANEIMSIGIQDGGNYNAYFERDPVTYGDANLHFVVLDSTSTLHTANTLFTPVSGTFYWFWVAWSGVDRADWRITADLVSAPLSSGTRTAPADTIYTAANILGLFIAANLFGSVAVDAVEICTTTRT